MQPTVPGLDKGPLLSLADFLFLNYATLASCALTGLRQQPGARPSHRNSGSLVPTTNIPYVDMALSGNVPALLLKVRNVCLV